jgi:hypothetical protein
MSILSPGPVPKGTTNPTVTRFLDRHREAPCLRCGTAVGQAGRWAMLAQVSSDKDVSGGRLCGPCVRSFGKWLAADATP